MSANRPKCKKVIKKIDSGTKVDQGIFIEIKP